MDNAIDYVEEEIVRHEWTGNVDNISRGQILVRCKDCVHSFIDNDGFMFCHAHKYISIEDEWYCADGVKKDA